MSAIFISHSTTDNAVAQHLLASLQTRGFSSVFLDCDKQAGIPVGADWKVVLRRRVRCCQAVVALVSDASLASPWCQFEVRLARELQKLIFPVALDGCKSSELLDLQHATVHREVAADPSVYEQLLVELESAQISKGRWDRTRPPYPGLLAFEEADAGVFFGQERVVELALSTLNELHSANSLRWYVLLGASGSGKSSLLRAGLVPALRADPKRWSIVGPLRPGTNPLESLAIALADLMHEQRRASELYDVLLGSEPAALIKLARELRLSARASNACIVLAIDQFEELLANAVTEAVHAFVALLRVLTTLDGAPFMVIATLRADFLGAFQNHPELRGIRTAELVVKPLDESELPRVIEEPGVLAGVTFEDGLVDQMVGDTQDGNALPLLAFVLRELYERFSDDELIELREYREGLGGLQSAVAKKADEVLARVRGHGTRDDDAELRSAFLSLVQIQEDGRAVRRPLRRSELSTGVSAKLDAFVDARLLVSNPGPSGEPQLEVAHEALFRVWPTVTKWIAENREFLAWRKRLDPLVAGWKEEGDSLLHRPELGEAETWLQKEERALAPNERAYIRKSLQAERRRAVVLWSNVAAGFLVVLVAAGFAFLQRQNAELEARRAKSGAFYTAGVLHSDPMVSVALFREARAPLPSDWEAAAYQVASRNFVSLHMVGHSASIHAVAFSPDGSKIATGAGDNTARVWNVDGAGPVVELRGHADDVISLAFSPDGSKILTGSNDKTARVWDVAGGEALRVLDGHNSAVFSVAFSPDGSKMLTGSYERTARIWNQSDPQPAVMLTGQHKAEIYVVAFSRDGTKVLTASQDGNARVWAADGSGSVQVASHGKPIIAAAFSPDGSKVVTGGEDTVRISSSDGSGVHVELPGHGNVLSVAFSPDGTKVLTSERGIARVWNANGSDGRPIELKFEGLSYATFSPDGTRVLTGSYGKTACLWNAAGSDSTRPLELVGHVGPIYAIAFSPDGKNVLTGSDDKSARVWREARIAAPTTFGDRAGLSVISPDGKKVVAALSDGSVRAWDVRNASDPGTALKTGHIGLVSSLAFSPDGTRVVSGSADATARVWNADGTGEVSPPFAHGGVVRAVAFSHGGEKIATASEDLTARVWHVGSGDKPIELPHPAKVTSVAFYPNDDKLLTGADDGIARVWDPARPNEPVVLGKHTGAINAVAVRADGSLIVTGSEDKTARIWNADGTGSKTSLDHGARVVAVAFSPNGKQVLTGSWDRHARVWSADGAHKVIPIEHSSGVLSVAFSPDGKQLLTGSGDKGANLWPFDVRTLLWRKSTYCLDTEERMQLLAESQDVAKAAHDSCRHTVEICQSSFQACAAEIATSFAPQ